MQVTLSDLARAWFVAATQSIGGGSATLLLIRPEIVEKRGWLTQRQFLEDYALSKMGLGINLVTLSGLIGSQLAGARGMVVSLASFVIPAATLAVLLTGLYTLVRDWTVVRAALAGAGPVTAGMTAGFAFTLCRQSVRRGVRGAFDWSFAIAVLVASLAFDLSPLVVIPTGIAVGVLLMRGQPSRASGETPA